MISMPELRTALLDLLYETREVDWTPIIGGGYGIFLKREHVRTAGIRTLLSEWPEARSTNDLDLFLRPGLLIDSARLKPLSDALKRLGYKNVAGAEKYQFAKLGPAGDQQGSVKVDLLTGPLSRFAGTKLKVDRRRVRPKPSIDLHAHPTDEAITLEQGLLTLTIEGGTGSGILHYAQVFVPHPFTFAMMKLFAFRDRANDPNKELGRYHALDLYSVLAMTSEKEWIEACEFRDQFRRDPVAREASQIVREAFSSPVAPGTLRLRESPYYRDSLQLDGFLAALNDLFKH